MNQSTVDWNSSITITCSHPASWPSASRKRTCQSMSLKRLRNASSMDSVGMGFNVSKSIRSIHSSASSRTRRTKSTMASRTAATLPKYALLSASWGSPPSAGISGLSGKCRGIASIVARSTAELQAGRDRGSRTRQFQRWVRGRTAAAHRFLARVRRPPRADSPRCADGLEIMPCRKVGRRSGSDVPSAVATGKSRCSSPLRPLRGCRHGPPVLPVLAQFPVGCPHGSSFSD